MMGGLLRPVPNGTKKNKTKSDDCLALVSIRNLLNTYTGGSVGMSDEDAMRMIAKVPFIYAGCAIDGIDLSAALTEDEIAVLGTDFEKNQAKVIEARAKAAEKKANSPKRGRPVKV